MMGYVFGKVEGKGDDWHGHVTALTVATEFRRVGVAASLMKTLEDAADHAHKGYFMDLFVRASNSVAIAMYSTLGYSVYRRVIGYYSGDNPEDALGKIKTRILFLFCLIRKQNVDLNFLFV